MSGYSSKAAAFELEGSGCPDGAESDAFLLEDTGIVGTKSAASGLNGMLLLLLPAILLVSEVV